MRVAMIVPGGMDPGGTHRVIPLLLWLVERVAREHELHVFAMRGGPSPPSYELRGATVHAIEPRTRSRRRTLPTLLALAGRHRATPFDVLHAFWAEGPGVVGAVASAPFRIPLLLDLPGGDLVALPDIGYGARLTLAGRVRVRMALAAADRRTAPNAATARQASAMGFPTERLPLGVDRDAWPPGGPTPRRPDEAARLIHVAGLNRVKDQPTLLRAFRRLLDDGVDATLDVVGEDTLDGAVQRRAAELGLRERVRFHGFLPQTELRPLVARAHLLLVSSRHEGMPVVALEAASQGVPTVGTEVGFLPEWAPDAAVAVKVGNDAALARETRELLADEPRRMALGLAARERALAEDADWSARRVLSIYRALVRGAPRA